jgi:LPXTG-motif cell wall-anchored protein
VAGLALGGGLALAGTLAWNANASAQAGVDIVVAGSADANWTPTSADYVDATTASEALAVPWPATLAGGEAFTFQAAVKLQPGSLPAQVELYLIDPDPTQWDYFDILNFSFTGADGQLLAPAAPGAQAKQPIRLPSRLSPGDEYRFAITVTMPNLPPDQLAGREATGVSVMLYAVDDSDQPGGFPLPVTGAGPVTWVAALGALSLGTGWWLLRRWRLGPRRGNSWAGSGPRRPPAARAQGRGP